MRKLFGLFTLVTLNPIIYPSLLKLIVSMTWCLPISLLLTFVNSSLLGFSADLPLISSHLLCQPLLMLWLSLVKQSKLVAPTVHLDSPTRRVFCAFMASPKLGEPPHSRTRVLIDFTTDNPPWLTDSQIITGNIIHYHTKWGGGGPNLT